MDSKNPLNSNKKDHTLFILRYFFIVIATIAIVALLVFLSSRPVKPVAEESLPPESLPEESIEETSTVPEIPYTDYGHPMRDPSELKASLDDAKAGNPDTVGWLLVPGTSIYAPVMQSTDNDYYLHHDYNKNKIARGAIYLDYRVKFENGKIKNCNSPIYGHHMKDGTALTWIIKYKKLDFLRSNPIIQYYTSENECCYYKVFSTMITDVDFYYINTDPTKDEYATMIQEMKDRSMYNCDVDVTTDDKIMLLSTCTYEYPKKDVRWVVVARQLRPSETLSVNDPTEHPDWKRPN